MKVENSKALITGGAGFIGSNLVEKLVEKGTEVTILDNLTTGSKKNLEGVNNQIDFIEASCSEISNLDFEDLDFIFHLGIPSSSPIYKENPSLVGRAISEFTEVMELVKETSSKLIYASSSSVYGRCDPPHREEMKVEPFDYYTEARLTMERLAKVYHELHSVNSVGLRFFSVYGPHERAKGEFANIISQFYWKMKEDERPVIYGDGEQARDFTHVTDVVDALLSAAEKNLGCEVVNIGTGKKTTFNKVVDMLNEKLGKSIKPKYVKNPIENYVFETLADLSKAEELLDYEPTVELDEGIGMMLGRGDRTGRE